MPPQEESNWFTLLGKLVPRLPRLGGPETDNSHAEPPVQSEGMDGAADLPNAGQGKRARDMSEQLGSANKKQRTYSQDEGRLCGIYSGGVPEDRVQVMVPTNSSIMDDEIVVGTKKTQANPVRSKPGANHQHRVQNNIHATQPGRVGRSNPSFKPPSFISTEAKPTRHTVARGKALNEDVGDGFAAQSKRRATNGAKQTSNVQSLVELSSDDDDDDFGTIQAVNGMQVSSNDGDSGPIGANSQSQSNTNYFAPREQRAVNQYLTSGLNKKRRRRSSGQNTPSGSSILLNEHRSPAGPISGSRNQPMNVDDLAKPSLPPILNTSTKPSTEKSRAKQTMPINLGEGVDNFDAESMRRRKDDRSLEKMNAGISQFNKPSGKERSANGVADHKNLRQPPSSDQEQSPLRKQFRRDSDTTPQQQQQGPRRAPLVKNMKSTSSQVNAIEESPDHLHGSNTALPKGQLLRNANPKATGSPSRKRSPSDLAPTVFTTKSTRTTKPAQTTERITESDEDENVRIPLEQIFSTGCVLDATVKGNEMSIDLLWQKERKNFLVVQNGQPYRIAGTEEYMTIGKQESTTWHEGKGSTKVMLRGPAREGRSNGIILLSFLDATGHATCFDWLFHATADTLKVKSEDKGRIEQIFHNQATDVKWNAKKYSRKAEAESVTSVVQAQQKPSFKRREQPATGEKIVYEPSDKDIKQHVSARSKMKGDTEQATSSSETSPHFYGVDNRPTRKSTRQSKPIKKRTPSPAPAPPRWTETHELETWHQSVMYPPTGARRVTVDFPDLERLDEGEFLNDNLVGYALRRIEEDMAPEHRSKVHFFNSYFFTSLTLKNNRRAFNYDAVKKWTKNDDLFSTPYVVVPMNENLHWFVAIICNLPSLKRKAALLDDEAADAAETPPASQTTSVQPSPIQDPDEIPDSQELDKNDNPDEGAMRQLSLVDIEKESSAGSETFAFDENGNVTSSGFEADRDGAVAHANGRRGKKSKKRGPSLRKYPTDKPTIITLDSFGVGHPGQVSTLKKYIEAEAMDKRGMKAEAGDIQGMTAAGLPVQSNYCDCGLYLVGYVAEFAKDPEGFVNKVLTRQLDQDGDFASFDPSKKRAEIREDLLKLHEDQDQARLAAKKAKKDKGKLPVTAVNAAQTSATPAPSNRPSPAPTTALPSAKQSAQAPLVTETALPKAPRGASEKHGHAHESSPDPTPDPHETSLKPDVKSGNDASDGEELQLEEVPPRALPAGASHRTKRTAHTTVPDRGRSSAESGNDEAEQATGSPP